ncbi:unnamed protein product [Caenorhabditis angaria]|uniref:Uncharacterized protein n=1 Tax=Caenorhabditis angaria TaxID=860376 RepID=A0A9P1IEJ7_9PELO|nr:unnamed protein product [Caenorhabditis angaria]
MLSRLTKTVLSGSGSGSGLRFASSAANNLFNQANLTADPSKVLFIEDDRQQTYGEFVKRAGQYATALTEKYNIKKGDRVMARVSKSIDTAALYIGCLQIGALYIPVNPGYTESEAAHYIKDATPSLLVTCNEELDKAFRSQINVLNELKLASEASTLKPCTEVEHVDPLDAACVCYTSGTTGLPKGAILTHGMLNNNAHDIVRDWGFTENDRNLHALPFYHVHGLYYSLHCSLFSHSSIIWRPKFEVEDTIKHMKTATVMMGVPTFYSRLLNSPNFTKDVFKDIRVFLSGSAPLSLATIEDFQKHTGHVILERYGMTEAGVMTTNPLNGVRKAGTVGPAVSGVGLRIAKNGGIEVKTNAIFAGYWKNAKKTAEEFTEDGWFKTGDVGFVDEDGYLTIGGRSKDMVITGGLNVYPKELEDFIDTLPFVEESAVIASPHPDFGEAVVAVVVPNDKSVNHKEFEQKLIGIMKKKVANYKVPKRVILLDSLPRNHISKIQKKELRDTYKNLFQ